ncbi:MAG: molybdenum cofactor biosynthesis protein MoaE [Polyangiales bacterium]
MKVRIRYFAAARELARRPDEEVDLGAGAHRISDLVAWLESNRADLGPHLRRMRFAVDECFSELESELREGSVVDVLPPVAGGSDASVVHVAIRESTLSLDEVFHLVSRPGAGAVSIFVGIVRDNVDGKSVSRLDYEAHDSMALSEMRSVLNDVSAKFEGTRLAAIHRVGELGIGDLAIVIACSAPHRAEAIAACKETIDRIKERVPIWKKEWSPDGTALWVNLDASES